MNRSPRAPVDRRVKLSLVVCGVVVGAVVACNGSSSNGGSGFVQQYCSMLTPCCQAAGYPANTQGCEQVGNSQTAGSGYNDSQGQACLSGLQGEQSAGTLCDTLGGDIPACGQVFQQQGGSTPPGGTCTQDSQCAVVSGGSATCFDQFTFLDGGTAQTQTCIQLQTGHPGDGPCIGTKNGSVTLFSWSGSGAPPSQAYLCDEGAGITCDGTTQKCTSLGQTGDPCTSDSACVAADYCAFTTTSGQCTGRVADGTSCATASTSCLTTSSCDSATQTCKPLLADGSACTTSSQCASLDCTNQKCANGATNLGLALLCTGL
ncbi:MAG TPA: hypothetical protein VIF09_11435 [Polyangiaceae bacterium]|jgi:hypothetical protein